MRSLITPVLRMFTVIILCCVQGALLKELIPFEPIQYIKSLTSPRNESSIWSILNEASPEHMGEMSILIKEKLNDLLQDSESGTNVLLAKGERIISKRISSNISMEDSSNFPFMNLLSFVSVSMTILLENFQSKLINEPIGSVLKGRHQTNPILDGQEARSLLNILNTLPTSEKETSVFASNSLFKEMTINGELAYYFVNSVLGSTANEAWKDALLAFGIDDNIISADHLKLSLFNILQYAITVIHDFHSMDVVPEIDIIKVEDQRYLFGWWVNCPIASNNCIFPELPHDLLFSVSSTLRIYISPGFELCLIVSNEKSNLKTINDIITVDRVIWKQVISVVVMDSSESLRKLKDGTDENLDKTSNRKLLVSLIHQVWPILVFLFWVISSHVWVYLLLHGCWFMATLVLRRAHIPRPKSANSK